MEILILTPKGETVKMSTWERESVIDLKKRISERLFMAPDLQRILFFHGRVLDDENSLGQFAIEDKSVITLVEGLRGSGIRIFAKTFDGRTTEMEVDQKETVLNLKKKIEEKLAINSDEQRLIYQNVTLSDDEKLEYYSMMGGSVIHVKTRLRYGPTVMVKTLDDKTFMPVCVKEDTVLDLKKRIEERLCIPYDEQLLVYERIILKDEKKLKDYPLSYDSVIHVVQIQGCNKSGLVVASDEKCVTVDYNGKETVLDLKKRIAEKISITPDMQVLNCHGVILEGDDEKNLDDYEITDSSVIKVTESASRQIFIWTPDDGTFKLEIGRTSTVRDLKRRIATKLSLTMEELNLVFEDIVLEDDTMIDKLNIVEDSVISVNIITRRIYFEKDGKEIFLPVGMEEKVSDIKRKICEKAESSSTDVQLCYKGGRRLEDDKTLIDYKIEDTDQIRVLFLW